MDLYGGIHYVRIVILVKTVVYYGDIDLWIFIFVYTCTVMGWDVTEDAFVDYFHTLWVFILPPSYVVTSQYIFGVTCGGIIC